VVSVYFVSFGGGFFQFSRFGRFFHGFSCLYSLDRLSIFLRGVALVAGVVDDWCEGRMEFSV